MDIVKGSDNVFVYLFFVYTIKLDIAVFQRRKMPGSFWTNFGNSRRSDDRVKIKRRF